MCPIQIQCPILNYIRTYVMQYASISNYAKMTVMLVEGKRNHSDRNSGNRKNRFLSNVSETDWKPIISPWGIISLNIGLYKSVDRRRKSKIVDVLKARRMLRAIISKHQFLIVDTHMPEGIVPKDATRMVFVLRCNPQILERRLRRRRWTSEKVKENVMAEILDSCLIAAQKYYGKRKVVQLDTSYASVKQFCICWRGRFITFKISRLSVDWLAQIGKRQVFRKVSAVVVFASEAGEETLPGAYVLRM